MPIKRAANNGQQDCIWASLLSKPNNNNIINNMIIINNNIRMSCGFPRFKRPLDIALFTSKYRLFIYWLSGHLHTFIPTRCKFKGPHIYFSINKLFLNTTRTQCSQVRRVEVSKNLKIDVQKFTAIFCVIYQCSTPLLIKYL